MADVKPLLADAARRLRADPPAGFPGRVGRPRKNAAVPATATIGAPSTSPESPPAGTCRAHPAPRTRVDSGDSRGALARQASALLAVGPRLLNVRGAGEYLGVSGWTIRDLIAAGKLRRVLIPGANGRDLRRVLLDRADLDALIDRWKDVRGAEAVWKPGGSS